MKKAVICLVFILAPLFSAYARTQEQQKAYDAGANIMSNLHTDLVSECDAADMISINKCISGKYAYYDKILNQLYQLALAENDAKTRIDLKESERKWLAFREAEDSAQLSYSMAEPRGSIMSVALGYQKLSAIRERIAELMMYLETDQG